MPNYCNNVITIEGPADKIRLLWDTANTPTVIDRDFGLLQAMQPMPADLEETFGATGARPGWYDWRIMNWGTKWDVSLEGLEFVLLGNGRAQITGYADSAWSPPVAAFDYYASNNPDCELELKYFEPGMCFIGVWDSNGGDAFWDKVHDLLDTTKEEDAVLHELIEFFNAHECYETDEDDEENLEIDLDGGLSAINED